MSTRYAPVWLHGVPKSRRPAYPRVRGRQETGVAIVGGGLTGCACAYVLAGAGVPVMVLEADRVGGGATAGALGLIREDPDARFRTAAETHGLRTARIIWAGMRKAASEMTAALRRQRTSCGLQPQDLLHVGVGEDARLRDLRRDYMARREAGLPHRWLAARPLAAETALAGGGAIRTRGAVLDPYRACVGLAAAAAARGAAVHEGSAVLRVRARGRAVELEMASGVVSAGTVVLATRSLLPELRPLRRHLQAGERYGVLTAPMPPSMRRELGRRGTVIRDDGEPPHFVRWMRGDRALVQGGDEPRTGRTPRPQHLVQRTAQLMYEFSLLYPAISGVPADLGWSIPCDDTADGLPCVGPHRNYPHHLFALGLDRHGAGASWLAARSVLRHVSAQPDRLDEALGFARLL